ncbi:DUF916 domain-containing protein [Enterococcus hulanensis]|uniref:WxL protein peptidoglycan domain-containing protein n=1 Tax=Enterococcus hulanensis TaxID=2559929 RepID=UPI001A8F3E5E|nr:DUF916 domain-containing protein [Enterococcus hulanensis]MBO0458106.1 DUF916 domain-containing protein [Enterococcus hulanensis]
MNNKNRLIAMIILILSVGAIFLGDTTVSAEGSDYSVVPFLPENQKSGTRSYYDIELKNDKPFELSFSIENISDEKKSFEVLGFDAVTNNNNIIDYSNSSLKSNVDNSKRLTNYLELPDTFTIEAGETDKVSVNIKSIDNDFEGYILGSIQIVPILNQERSGITNLFTRTIAVRLWGSKKSESLSTRLTDLPENFSVINKEETVISYTLKNETPQIEKDVVIRTVLKKKDGVEDKIVSDNEQKFDFAPSSIVNREDQLDKKLEDGEYVYEVFSTIDSKKLANYSYEFTIKKGDTVSDYSLFGILMVMMIILLVLIFIFIKRRKLSEKIEEK